MASARICDGPGYSVTVEYNAANGRVSGVKCVNDRDMPLHVDVVLTDGSAMPFDFPAGTTTPLLPISGNRVQYVVDPVNSEEGMLVGLQALSIVPL